MAVFGRPGLMQLRAWLEVEKGSDRGALAVFDQLGLLQQLGAIPAPGGASAPAHATA